MVTLKDIARKVGMSVTTVSRALNDYNDVNPETKLRIRQAAEEMGYRPNILAQRLQKQKADTIGFIIPTYGPRFSDPFFSEFLAGVGNKASAFGFDLLVSTHPPGDQELEAYRKFVEGRKVDGLIIVRTRQIDERVNYLLEKDFPFTVFGSVEGKNDFLYVDEDGAYGMCLVTQHLINLGYKRISCIVPDPNLMFAKKRLAGFNEALANANLEIPEEYIKQGDLTQRSGYVQTLELLSLKKRPDAVVACNDLMAFGAISAAQEKGLVVGKDIAVTGFDDIPLAEHFHPPLTTVHQPIYKIGNMVCEMLVGQILNKTITEKRIILKPNLIIRQSCGAHIS